MGIASAAKRQPRGKPFGEGVSFAFNLTIVRETAVGDAPEYRDLASRMGAHQAVASEFDGFSIPVAGRHERRCEEGERDRQEALGHTRSALRWVCIVPSRGTRGPGNTRIII